MRSVRRGFAWRLWWKLVRGGGRSGVVRLVAMLAGISLAVTAMMLVLSIPRVMNHQDDVTRARAPFSLDNPTASGLGWKDDTVLSGQTVVHRYEVSNVQEGSQRPPGVSAWPRAGQALVSPGYWSLPVAARDAQHLHVAGTIASSGLTSPTEVVIYNVESWHHPGQVGQVGGFGGMHGTAQGRGPAALVDGEVLLLVVMPAVLFLVACLRLVTTSRARAHQATFLIGMPHALWRKVRAIETTILVLGGTIVGLWLYGLVQAPIGNSGVLGVSWFPDAGRRTWLTTVVVLAVAAFITWASVRLVARPTRRMNSTRRWPGRVAMFISVGAGLYLTGLLVAQMFMNHHDYNAPTLLATYAGALSLMLGAPTAAQELTRRVAGRIGTSGPGVGIRLGGRLAAAQSSHLAVIAALLAVITTSSALAPGILTGLKVDALGDPFHASIQFSMDGLPAQQRQNLRALNVPVVLDIVPANGTQVSDVTVATCHDIAAVMPLPAGSVCKDEPQSGQDPHPVTITLTNGSHVRVDPGPVGSFPWTTKIPPSAAPWAWDATDAQLTYQASHMDASFDHLVAALRNAAPAATIQEGEDGIQDPLQWGIYRQQTALLRGCAIVGDALALIGIILTLTDLRRRQRRPLVSLAAIGAPARTMRVATATSYATPLLAPGLIYGLFGTIAALNTVAAGWGTKIARLVVWNLLGWALLPALTITLIAAAVGALLRPPTFDRSAIQDY